MGKTKHDEDGKAVADPNLSSHGAEASIPANVNSLPSVSATLPSSMSARWRKFLERTSSQLVPPPSGGSRDTGISKTLLPSLAESAAIKTQGSLGPRKRYFTMDQDEAGVEAGRNYAEPATKRRETVSAGVSKTEDLNLMDI